MFPSHDPAALSERSFAEACANNQTDLFKYPKDFALYRIGEYDDATGEVQNLEPNKLICEAIKYNKEELQA